jgi:hypothetical protein
VGDETIQFASRFATAVGCLSDLASGRRDGQLDGLTGDALAATVRDALDAVQAVCETATKDVRDWPEQRRRILAQVAAVRDALRRGRVDDRVRALAGAVVDAIGPASGRS